MKSNIITGAVVIGVIAIIAIAYQSLVVVPQNKIDAQEREARADRLMEIAKEADRKSEYESCKASAYRVYSQNWDAKCELIGEEADCSLYPVQSDQINQWHKEAQEDCLAIYKAG